MGLTIDVCFNLPEFSCAPNAGEESCTQSQEFMSAVKTAFAEVAGGDASAITLAHKCVKSRHCGGPEDCAVRVGTTVPDLLEPLTQCLEGDTICPQALKYNVVPPSTAAPETLAP